MQTCPLCSAATASTAYQLPLGRILAHACPECKAALALEADTLLSNDRHLTIFAALTEAAYILGLRELAA